MILGNLSFQANDKMDVFHVAQVQEDGIESSDVLSNPFVITVYVECEMAEELEEVVDEDKIDEEDNDYLEPMEINL
ncbi:MAG: hypothetical protein IPJ20_19870 [Flammeovirgaceae bacterium]|nr:hypothetical protein [Flammeovirgaceae bacterium]